MAVTDFYKHPFRRVSELKKPALDDMEHRHSSGRTDGEKRGTRSESTCENESG